MHDASMDLSKSLPPSPSTACSKIPTDADTVIGVRCGRLACHGLTANLGPPLVLPDKNNCGIQSDDPSGQSEIAEPTATPARELLYIRRGMVYRQFPQTNTTSTSTTASVLITLTPHLSVPGAVNTATSTTSAALLDLTVVKVDGQDDN